MKIYHLIFEMGAKRAKNLKFHVEILKKEGSLGGDCSEKGVFGCKNLRNEGSIDRQLISADIWECPSAIFPTKKGLGAHSVICPGKINESTSLKYQGATADP